jgi:hypothetical protein
LPDSVQFTFQHEEEEEEEEEENYFDIQFPDDEYKRASFCRDSELTYHPKHPGDETHMYFMSALVPTRMMIAGIALQQKNKLYNNNNAYRHGELKTE